MSTKVDTRELVTPTQAAERLGVTRQWVDSLLRRRKIPIVEIAGKRFLRWEDARDYQPEVGGRPSLKAQSEQNGKKKGLSGEVAKSPYATAGNAKLGKKKGARK